MTEEIKKGYSLAFSAYLGILSLGLAIAARHPGDKEKQKAMVDRLLSSIANVFKQQVQKEVSSLHNELVPEAFMLKLLGKDAEGIQVEHVKAINEVIEGFRTSLYAALDAAEATDL